MASAEPATAPSVKLFTRDEVAQKGNKTNAAGESESVWLIIHDGVYDVTKFLNEVRKRYFSNLERIFLFFFIFFQFFVYLFL